MNFVSREEVEGNIEIPGEQNSLFPLLYSKTKRAEIPATTPGHVQQLMAFGIWRETVSLLDAI